MINTMQISFFFIILFLLSCQTINQKTDEAVQKENKKLSKLIGKSIEELKIHLGEPDLIDKNEINNVLLTYKSKKYGISCVRVFEINKRNNVVSFSSKGCF